MNLTHYPGQIEQVLRDREEVLICRPLCGSEQEWPIFGHGDSVVTCEECRSIWHQLIKDEESAPSVKVSEKLV